MREAPTTPIGELLAPRRHTTCNIVLRAQAGNPHATPETLAYITHIRVGLVRWALGIDADGDAVPAAAVVTAGTRKRGGRVSATKPMNTKPMLWSDRSAQRLQELKAAQAKHRAWLQERGIEMVTE